MLIKIKTQAEWDALPGAFKEFTEIRIISPESTRISISKIPDSSHVVARDSSHVEARDSSHVVARDSSHVEARDSSHVVARDSSHVVARDSSHVEAWGSSHVVARDSSHVEAWGSSHVVARDSSHVVAWGNTAVHNQSIHVHLELFGFAVAILAVKAKKLLRKSKTATVVKPAPTTGTKGWLGDEGVPTEGGSCILFKRVSKQFLTQEGTSAETKWEVKRTLTHPHWTPKLTECGGGKFHACSRPYFCDEFRSTPKDRYVAIEVSVKDLHAWPAPQYPHKIAFRKGRVLYECDSFGKRI